MESSQRSARSRPHKGPDAKAEGPSPLGTPPGATHSCSRKSGHWTLTRSPGPAPSAPLLGWFSSVSPGMVSRNHEGNVSPVGPSMKRSHPEVGLGDPRMCNCHQE